MVEGSTFDDDAEPTLIDKRRKGASDGRSARAPDLDRGDLVAAVDDFQKAEVLEHPEHTWAESVTARLVAGKGCLVDERDP
jgi:hypothetical protein